jgi:hypothetical protein
VIFFVSYEFFNERRHQYPIFEYEDNQMMPEINQVLKNTFSNLEFPVVLSCGDDRGVSQESLDTLVARGLPMDRPFLRLFGGKYGATNILAVATTAQYGLDFAKAKLGSDFHSLADEVANRAADLNVYMVSHSSQGAENSPAEVDILSDGPLGCARIAALGKVNQLSAKDQLSIRVAEADSAAIFSISGQKAGFHKLPGAFATASHIYFGENPQSYAISRKEVADSPVMILVRNHAGPEKDGVIHVVNLQKDKLSDVNEAVARGSHYYDSDVTIVAETLMRSFPELRLDPQILLNVMLLDQAATRSALAGGDGPADPQRIPSYRYGDGQEALSYLSSL